MSPLKKFDIYESKAIESAARTGARELGKLREALEGKRAFGAQVRLLCVLSRRGHIDLAALIESVGK
jgi:hypothetical protein